MAEKYLAVVTLLFTCLVWGSNASHDEGNFVSASLFFSATPNKIMALQTRGGGGGTSGISGWACAAGTLEPLTYTRASLAEFCYPILE